MSTGDWRDNYSEEEIQRYSAETEGASDRADFDPVAHDAATGGGDTSGSNSSSDPSSTGATDSGATDSGNDNATNDAPSGSLVTDRAASDSSEWSREVQEMSQAERDYYYAQVGDAMYAPGWSLSGHIEGNTVNGVFTPPSYTSPAVDTAIPNASGNLPSGDLSDTSRAVSPAVQALSETAKANLYAQVGDAMYAPGFSLSAHIKSNTVDGVFRAPTYVAPDGLDQEDDAAAEQNSEVDWLNWLTENDTRTATVSERLKSENLLKLPDVDSPAWLALMEETGGAAANPGFNYAAHVAAVTSQNVLTGLTEAEVLSLIAETGRTHFDDFDFAKHQSEKSKAIQKAEKALGKLVQTKDQADGSLVDEEEIEIAQLVLLGSDTDDLIDATDEATTKVVLAGGAGNDVIKASSKNNVLIGGEGNDSLDGGSGIDTAAFEAGLNEIVVQRDEAGEWIVESDAEGRDVLVNVERISTADQSLALDIDGNAGQMYRVYKAAFNRDPMQGDTTGLGYWIDQADGGMDVVEVAARFIDSDEFRDTYGAGVSDETYIDALYENVLGRLPDEEGRAWWIDQIANNPEKSREKVLADFAESTENQDAVIDLIGNGIVFDQWVS